MKKDLIGLEEYTTAEILAVMQDDKMLCNIAGERAVDSLDENGNAIKVIMPLFDSNIAIENGKFFTLSEEELLTLKNQENGRE